LTESSKLKSGGDEAAAVVELDRVVAAQQEARAKKEQARLISLEGLFAKKYPDVGVEDVRRALERARGDEKNAETEIKKMREMQKEQEKTREHQQRTAAKEEEEAVVAIVVDEKRKEDPVAQLRLWLRSVGLHAIEYALIELDRMSCLSELLTWSFDDLQLLNLTDQQRHALFASMSHLNYTSNNYNKDNNNTNKDIELNVSVTDAANADDAGGNDDEEEEEASAGWLGELEYLAPRLCLLGVRSRADLDARMEQLPLSFAERDALARVLATARGTEMR
jgi:hypothetical protein